MIALCACGDIVFLLTLLSLSNRIAGSGVGFNSSDLDPADALAIARILEEDASLGLPVQ